jgi:hypothetical protein
LITQTTDRAFAEDLMRERHWVDDTGAHYVVTSVLLMADTPGRDTPIWSVHGRLERDDETCPIGGP